MPTTHSSLWTVTFGLQHLCKNIKSLAVLCFGIITNPSLPRLVVIPLAFLRRLDSLKYTSVVALVSIGYLVVLVVYHFCKGDTKIDRGEIRVVEWGGAIATLSSFPVVVFAYTCHQNVSGCRDLD